jgi:hypothetical protein
VQRSRGRVACGRAKSEQERGSSRRRGRMPPAQRPRWRRGCCRGVSRRGCWHGLMRRGMGRRRRWHRLLSRGAGGCDGVQCALASGRQLRRVALQALKGFGPARRNAGAVRHVVGAAVAPDGALLGLGWLGGHGLGRQKQVKADTGSGQAADAASEVEHDRALHAPVARQSYDRLRHAGTPAKWDEAARFAGIGPICSTGLCLDCPSALCPNLA